MEQSTLLTCPPTPQPINTPAQPPLISELLANSPFGHYFAQQAQRTSNLAKVQQIYSSGIQQRLAQGIQQGSLELGARKKEFKVRCDEKPTEEQRLQQQKLRFEEKKQSVLESLHQIYQQEKDLLIKNRSLLRHSRLTRSQTQINYRGPQRLQDSRTAALHFRNFKRWLQEKERKAAEFKEWASKQPVRERMVLIGDIRARNHAQSQRRKMSLERSKEEQTKLQKECESFLRKVKPTVYRYKKLEEEFQQQLKKSESEKNLRLEDYRRRRQIEDWGTFNQHQQDYLESLEQRKQAWFQRFHSLKEDHRSRLKVYRGKFAHQARQEDQAMREEAVREGSKGLQIVQKMKEYQQYVHEHFKPRSTSRANPETPAKQEKKHIELDRTAIRLKGLEYLNKVKETVRSSGIQPSKHLPVKSESLPKLKHQSTHYKDYLREMPTRSKADDDRGQFKNALTERRGRWAESALSLISKMETKDWKKGDRPMISSAFDKIELLKAMVDREEI